MAAGVAPFRDLVARRGWSLPFAAASFTAQAECKAASIGTPAGSDWFLARARGPRPAAVQLAAFRLTPFRSATVDSFLSAAFSSLRLVREQPHHVVAAELVRPGD